MKRIDLIKEKGHVYYYCDGEESAKISSNWGALYDYLNEEIGVLNDAEKDYLGNIIRPFASKVESIRKWQFCNYEYIEITYREYEQLNVIDLPRFRPKTMYTGMEPGHEYTIEELGLK